MKKSKSSYQIYLVIFSLILTLSMIFTQPGLASIEASNRYEMLRPVIVQLNNDETISQATHDLQATIKTARIVKPVSKQELIEIEKKAVSEVFIIGHGNSEGLQLLSGNLNWKEVGEAIDSSPSFKHYILACYSSMLNNHPKVIRTFKGLIDVDIALVVTKATREVASLSSKTKAERNLYKSTTPEIDQIIAKCQKEVIDLWINKIKNNDFQFLITISRWRGWYWDRWPGDDYRYIHYDHPDRAIHHISIYTTCVKPNYNTNVHVIQLDKYFVDALDAIYTALDLVFTSIISAYIGVALAAVLSATAAIVAGIIIGVMLGILGIVIHELLNYFFKDEEGAIWAIIRDIKLNKIWFIPFSVEYYLKMGAVWWLGITHILGNPASPIIVPSLTGNNHQITRW